MTKRVAGQGERCVILWNGRTSISEVVAREDGLLTLLSIDGEEWQKPESELAPPEWTAVLAWKIIKVDGSWVYIADGPKHAKNPTGRQVYSREGVHV